MYLDCRLSRALFRFVSMSVVESRGWPKPIILLLLLLLRPCSLRPGIATSSALVFRPYSPRTTPHVSLLRFLSLFTITSRHCPSHRNLRGNLPSSLHLPQLRQTQLKATSARFPSSLATPPCRIFRRSLLEFEHAIRCGNPEA